MKNLATRPGKGTSVARPDLTIKPDQLAKTVAYGQRLYENKYGCNGCHSIGPDGGKVGPALDRAGFRLNGTWVYRWLKNPQAMNAGNQDAGARAQRCRCQGRDAVPDDVERGDNLRMRPRPQLQAAAEAPAEKKPAEKKLQAEKKPAGEEEVKLSRLQDRCCQTVFSLPLLEQKSCNHSNKDRGSYPYMLLKHVEGGGSRYGSV